MSEELKNRTKKFALDVTPLCAGFPQVLETRHAFGQIIRSSSSAAANYRSACCGKSKADFISKLSAGSAHLIILSNARIPFQNSFDASIA